MAQEQDAVDTRSATSRVDGTKLSPPRRPVGALTRTRLLDRVEQTPPAGTCLLVAGPGFGKTQVLTDIARTATRAAWLTIDEADDDPDRLWRHLATAIDPDRSDACRTATDLLELLDAEPVDWVLLDDVHLLHDPETCRDLAGFAARVPPTVRILAASRRELTWTVGPLQADGRLVTLRERELAFDPAEVTAVAEIRDLDLDEAAGSGLWHRTEGWPAGVQLALSSALDHDDPLQSIRDLRGDRRSIADFLLEEALDRQPPELRAFLMQTSVLDRLSGPLCNAVTGRTDSGRILAELERHHVFVYRLTGDAADWYRYHRLFADLLRAELEADDADRAQALHRRAAHALRATGDHASAIRHLLAAGDRDDAALLLEEHQDDYYREGRTALLLEVWDALDDDSASDLRLLSLVWRDILFEPLTRRAAKTIDRLRERVGGADAPPELAAQISVVDAHLAAVMGDTTGMARHATAASAEFDRIGAGFGMRGDGTMYAVVLAARAAIWSGRAAEADAMITGRLTGEPVDEYTRHALNGTRAAALVELGRAEEAVGLAVDAVRWLMADGSFVGALDASYAATVALHATGRADEVPEALALTRKVANRLAAGMPFLPLLDVVAAEHAMVRGDLDGAQRALTDARNGRDFPYARRRIDQAEQQIRALKAERAGVIDLTEREEEVLRQLPGRTSLAEIAADLYVSPNTVKTHLKSIYTKLDVGSRDEAVRRARTLHLLPDQRD